MQPVFPEHKAETDATERGLLRTHRGWFPTATVLSVPPAQPGFEGQRAPVVRQTVQSVVGASLIARCSNHLDLKCIRKHKDVSITYDPEKFELTVECPEHRLDRFHAKTCIDLTDEEGESQWKSSVRFLLLSSGMEALRFGSYQQKKYLIYKEFQMVRPR